MSCFVTRKAAAAAAGVGVGLDQQRLQQSVPATKRPINVALILHQLSGNSVVGRNRHFFGGNGTLCHFAPSSPTKTMDSRPKWFFTLRLVKMMTVVVGQTNSCDNRHMPMYVLRKVP